MAKGGQQGATHHKAKLTTEDVLAIRRRRANGESVNDLAVAFPVGKNQIRKITNGKDWTHVGGERTYGRRSLMDAEAIYQSWAHGERISSISARLDYHKRGVSKLIREAGGRARRDLDMWSLRQSGEPPERVAVAFGCSRATVYKAIARHLRRMA